MKKQQREYKYPGSRVAMDGNSAVIMCERESSDGAGAYPITPSTQMGEYWAEEVAKGHLNISGRPLIFIEPEGEHAAAAVTAGLSMTGLRATNFSSGQGIAYMHESLYAAVGKRLTYVLNMGCRAMTKASLNVHAGHDDYHSVDDTGFFQVIGKSAQEACDLNIIAHRIAELSLNPGIVAQDGFLTTHLIESLMLPERELIAEYLGRPDDIIETPTPAQRILFGEKRRRIPELWDVDNPGMAGTVQNQDAYMQSVAAQRPFFFDHIREITDECMDAFFDLTGRQYSRVSTYKTDDADYLIVGQGSVIPTAECVADYLRAKRRLKVGVVNVTMFRPFPGDLIGGILKGRKGVAVLERVDQPLAEDLPLIREIRSTVSKCVENGRAPKNSAPYPTYARYDKANDTPPLYSGSFGLGSRDLQPEGVVGAVENMLDDGPKRKFYYLSVDFVHDEPYTPKQEIYQQQVLDAYPHIRDLAIRGSENPNLMPKDSITVRFHSVGGWGAITTGKNLAMTLFDLLEYHVKANPKYGSEKKGQPTTYYLSAAPEPIRVNCEYFYVDVVLSADPNVFQHSNAIAGLKKGGTFIIQSELGSPQAVWSSIPPQFRRIIRRENIRTFYLDAFKIAREEASDPEMQFRMQGNAFQGAFFAASHVMKSAQLTEESLLNAIDEQLHAKFGSKGARVVEDNLRVVRRGFEEVIEIDFATLEDDDAPALRTAPDLPPALKMLPAGDEPLTDIHRFWEQTGSFYMSGKGSDNLVDPFIGLSLVPAATGAFRDMTMIRFEHPQWNPDRCTGCGHCYTQCPDSAIPGLVNSVGEVLDTALRRVERDGHEVKHLRRAVRTLERKVRSTLSEKHDADVQKVMHNAIAATIEECELDPPEREELETEFDWFTNAMAGFEFALTQPYHAVREKESPGSGGLLSITINPYTCKGCMECVAVCDDEALLPIPQTDDSVQDLRARWDFWQDLPSTQGDFIRIDDLDERIGALETLLLDKRNYESVVAGDGACLGCGEKTVVHVFTSTVEALMQPRVKKHVAYLEELIVRLDRHVRMKLVAALDLDDITAVDRVLKESKNADLTFSHLAAELEAGKASEPLDQDWLRWVTQLEEKLKHLKWCYTEGTTKRGRAPLGMINATGCTSVWGSTYPFNPYPFPWANHLFQDSPSVAMGVFEGHMAKMAEGFKAIRMAELELEGGYNAEKDAEFFTYFDWRDFSDEEFLLCPPVVAVGGDGAMYDIGFQNLSRMLMTGRPIKVLVLDTQVYSNTGGQACTSGFEGQVSDMAQFGKRHHGKEEIRKEIGLIGMAHRTAYVLQSAGCNATHLIEGYIEGLNSRRPALFNIYAPCQPEHGIGDDASFNQSKLAVESRAYPLFSYNPDHGADPADCFNLQGNPSLDEDWPAYSLEYVDEDGSKATLEVPMTFADFAVTEGRFRKHFRKAPRDTWNENMLPLSEYLDLSEDDREERFPYIWGVDKKQELIRIIPTAELVASCEERRDFWRMLKAIAGKSERVNAKEIEQRVRAEMTEKVTARLTALVNGGDGGSALELTTPVESPSVGASDAIAAPPQADNGYEAAWIDTPQCTSCDECININPNVFAYNEDKKAYVQDAKGGTFKDLVRAAEKCTARIIHPGTPFDPNEPDLEKLVKRAQKFQ